MKVDIQKMDEAYIQLENLQRQLLETEETIRNVTDRLMRSPVGGAAETEAITQSLRSQLKNLEQRTEGAKQLAQVLRSVTDQYRDCEKDAGRQSQEPIWQHFRPGTITDQLEFIRPQRITEVIDQYIMPFIVK